MAERITIGRCAGCRFYIPHYRKVQRLEAVNAGGHRWTNPGSQWESVDCGPGKEHRRYHEGLRAVRQDAPVLSGEGECGYEGYGIAMWVGGRIEDGPDRVMVSENFGCVNFSPKE